MLLVDDGFPVRFTVIADLSPHDLSLPDLFMRRLAVKRLGFGMQPMENLIESGSRSNMG
jgi:hypothetical protein